MGIILPSNSKHESSVCTEGTLPSSFDLASALLDSDLFLFNSLSEETSVLFGAFWATYLLATCEILARLFVTPPYAAFKKWPSKSESLGRTFEAAANADAQDISPLSESLGDTSRLSLIGIDVFISESTFPCTFTSA